MHRHGHCDGSDCGCHQDRMNKFMEPCLLLLLRKNPSHGYELLEKLQSFGFSGDASEGATLYRTLRRLESMGSVVSEWEAGDQGPARRLYRLTPEGHEALDVWAVGLRSRVARLERFLALYSGCEAD